MHDHHVSIMLQLYTVILYKLGDFACPLLYLILVLLAFTITLPKEA
jgi:hypothetical protein